MIQPPAIVQIDYDLQSRKDFAKILQDKINSSRYTGYACVVEVRGTNLHIIEQEAYLVRNWRNVVSDTKTRQILMDYGFVTVTISVPPKRTDVKIDLASMNESTVLY